MNPNLDSQIAMLVVQLHALEQYFIKSPKSRHVAEKAFDTIREKFNEIQGQVEPNAL